ncbi:MAG: PqqD family peptide modification chaperone [Duncaniella sp.]|nr:PqqD family peptide modification chaperone [Duncaniella sp.]
MIIRQAKNSYIRCTETYGYITNQLTRLDRVYNETGAFFLRQIGRTPTSFDTILTAAVAEYGGDSYDEIAQDLEFFLLDLESNGFIVTGENIDELESKDQSFTYDVTTPTTMSETFTQETKDVVSENTQDFFLEEVQGRPLISAIQFELSSRCNERCIHCYIPNQKKDAGADMPLEKVKSILDEFSAMGGIHVTLSGGEAFLHKDLMDICDYCREKDLKITILSNLIALTDAQVERLRNVNISLIQTSLYSMDPDIHDRITTVKGSFARTKRAIEKLVAADIPVQISCPLMKANYKGYKEVLDYAKSLKIKAQTDYIMMAQADLDDSNLANRLSLAETEEVIRAIIENDLNYLNVTLNQKSLSDDVKFDRERFKQQPVCGVGYDNCCITVNGDVYPCAGWQDYVLGNVYKNTLKEIWEESERVKSLRKITQASFPQCVECEALNFCNRCLVRNYNESNGDMMKVPKHFCDIAFLNKRLVEEYEDKLKDKFYQS